MSDSIFSELIDKEIEEILKLAVETKIPANTLIFKQNDPGEALYIIKDGQVKLEKISDAGDTLNMGIAESGMFLGELAILDGKGQPFTATTMTDTIFLKIDKKKLDILQKINKRLLCKFYLSIIRYINFRLRQANEKFASSRDNVQNL